MRIITTFLSLFILMLPLQAKKTKTVEIKLIETSDVHGMFFPINYMTGKPIDGTLARVSSYVKAERKKYGNNLILLENGDLLQGQPTNYYWNFINTKEPNIGATIINYMGYDAQNFGNHDVETGHKVYDKWIKEVKCPVLGANIINDATGEPYVTPYIILEREGVKIAILGMLTPAIPNWLSKDIWEGMHFEEMISSAKRWVKVIKEKEKPDVIIGLFHAGKEGGITTPDYCENASKSVAEQVPGFDIIFYGHDHQPYCGKTVNSEGKSVYIIDPANHAKMVGEAIIKVTLDGKKVINKEITASLPSMKEQPVDEDYMQTFQKEIKELEAFTSKVVGTFETSVYTRDAFFGSSAFSDLVHNLQLSITGADISFNAPLMMNASIEKGPVTMADMFNLYKYENKLYMLKMRGSEIHKYLEMSYSLWTNQMKTTDDHILLFDETHTDKRNSGLKNAYYNFDSAAGIIYTVDVTKPKGEKITIISMADGTPFSEDAWYKVSMNSYRGNGGGELLTRGAGIPKDEIESRIIYRSELDMRYYFMKEIERLGHIYPKANNNWHFIPDEYAIPGIIRDKAILFGK